VEIREFAESVLFADSIDGKLLAADSLSDRQPRSNIPVPELPGRPPGMRLDDERPRQKFPGLAHGAEPARRGQILHHFANHELLAIELMAVFLLRFPEAPRELRVAVAGTIGEEQQHLRLYQGRMAGFGVQLGDVPVSRFFWDSLAQMSSPLEYLAGMSLCLEQANLDFSRHYIARFQEIGDQQTAALLQQVYDDEIGHVRLGTYWFKKLRAAIDTRSFWERFAAELRMPLTPARAIGIGFDRRAREAAGLTGEFIEALEAFSHSKGRSPDLYLFNPSAEIHLAANRVVELPTAITGLARDLETLPMFLAGRDDAVLVSAPPRPAFLATLRQAGFELPSFVTAEQLDPNSPLRHLRPWAWSPDAEHILEPLIDRQSSLRPVATPARCYSKSWSLALARRWSVEHNEDWLGGAGIVGAICRDVDEALTEIADLRETGDAVVIKAPFGSAGRGMVRVVSDDELPTTRAWIERVLAQQGEVIIEPWLNRVLDISAQISVRRPASGGRGADVRIHGITRFVTDRRGQYESTLLGDPLRGLSESLKMAVVGPGRGWRMFEHMERCARFVGQALYEAGHEGPAGVDALVYEEPGGGYRLKPIVEVNPRYTMGHVALRISRALGGKEQRRFRIVSEAIARREGADSLEEYAAALPTGAVCLTDSRGARHALAVLVQP
jgi:uncharacterized ferritin-like protein (DUF455 family)